jgi:hypothetical protein
LTGDKVLVAKDTKSDAAAVYRKKPDGSCSKTIIPPFRSPPDAVTTLYRAHGTPGDDIIVVMTEGAPLNWCGFSGIRPLKSLVGSPFATLQVFGDEGADVIWVNDANIATGPGAFSTYLTVYGGKPPPGESQDTAGNFINAGSSHPTGGTKDDVILTLMSRTVFAGSGNDLMCTEVANVPFTPTVGAFWLDGGPGTDTRSGRPSNGGDMSMEVVGGTFERDRCSLAYLYMYGAVLGMLSEG